MSGKPRMPEAHRERALAAKAKMEGAWTAPGFVTTGGPHSYDFDCPFRDEDREHWLWLVAEALGTRNLSVINYSLNALTNLCSVRWKEGEDEPDPWELNTALSIIAACEPENEAQASIAMQMVALHFAGMKLAAVSGRYSWGADERSVSAQARVARTMASLQESLARLQGKLKPRAVNQTIQVVYIDQRDQRQQSAVVGGEGAFGGRGHATEGNQGVTYRNGGAGIAPQCTALPSPCADYGAAMPPASGEGQARLQDAWWWQRLWRTAWGAQRRVPSRRLD